MAQTASASVLAAVAPAAGIVALSSANSLVLLTESGRV